MRRRADVGNCWFSSDKLQRRAAVATVTVAAAVVDAATVAPVTAADSILSAASVAITFVSAAFFASDTVAAADVYIAAISVIADAFSD